MAATPDLGQRAPQVLGVLSDSQCVGGRRRFKHMMWTSHVQQPGEMRGKASNVDWAAREAHMEFGRLGARHKGTLWFGLVTVVCCVAVRQHFTCLQCL